MSNEEQFERIAADLGSGKTDGITMQLQAIADSTDDPYEVLKCLSMLKLVPNDGTESRIANSLVDRSDAENGLEIAKALQNLGLPIFALDVIKKAEQNDKSLRVKAHCLYDIEEYESAMDVCSKIEVKCVNDRILETSLLNSVGEHRKAIESAVSLLSEYPDDYDVRVSYVTALMMGGDNKTALKYSRDGIKDKTADSYAVAAYVLRIQGNIKAAGGYASRAAQIDNGHIGAMESLGICLALKEEYGKAKIVAGAINEVSPGDKAAINVLSYCEGH